MITYISGYDPTSTPIRFIYTVVIILMIVMNSREKLFLYQKHVFKLLVFLEMNRVKKYANFPGPCLEKDNYSLIEEMKVCHTSPIKL